MSDDQRHQGIDLAVHAPNPDTAVVAVTGEIDIATAPAFADGVAAALPGHRVVVVDLTKVTFLASAGITVLLVQAAAATALGVRLPIVADQPAVRRPLELTGLDAELDLHLSVTTALD